MVKKIVLLLVLLVVPVSTLAKKTTFIATDHRFNYVMIKEVDPSVAEARTMTHPAEINEQGLRTALESINLERSFLIKKEVQSRRVFNDAAVDYLAPNFIRAFKQANPMEEVVFSYMMKEPFFIIRNDRLNVGRAWLHGEELHIKIDKLFAQVTGDTDKRGYEGRAVNRARGLRVKLEYGPGQLPGSTGDEIVLNLHYNYAEKPEIKEAPPDVTMAGEVVTGERAEGEAASTEKSQVKKGAEKGDELKTAPETSASVGGDSVKERLQKLEELKKEGLISKKEYKEKRREILKDL